MSNEKSPAGIENSSKFQEVAEKFGTEKAMAAYKRAEQMAMAELAQESSAGNPDSKSNDETIASEDAIVGSAAKAENTDALNPLDHQQTLDEKTFKFMMEILSESGPVTDPHLLVDILNGDVDPKTFDKYFQGHKN